MSPATKSMPAVKRAAHTLALCLGAVVGNYLSIPLMFGVDFIFGSIFTVFALLTLGLLPALAVAIAGGIYTLILWGHPYALVIFIAEILVLWALTQRNYKNTVILDLIYWSLIGIPLVMIFYSGVMKMEMITASMIALKQTLNGVFNVLCVKLFLSLQLSRRKEDSDASLSFEQLIFYPLLSIILIIGSAPLIWDGLLLRSSLEKQLESRLHDQLITQANTLSATRAKTISLTGLDSVKLYKFNNTQQVKSIEGIREYAPQATSSERLTIYLPQGKMSTMQRWHQGIYHYQLSQQSPTQILTAVIPATKIIDVIERERTLEFLMLSFLLLLGLGISKALSHWLAIPLRSMMLLSYNIEKKVGTNETISYPHSNILEYQRLSDSLQRMSENLSRSFQQEQQYHQSLEAQVKERTEELSLVIDNTGVGIWDWHIDSGDITLNERWANIIGYTLEELAPINIDTWLKHCHPDDLKNSEKLLQEYWLGNQPLYTCEARMKHKAGHWVWVLDSGRTVEWNADGKPLRMVGTHLDVTARKQAEAEMETLSRIASQTSNAVIITNVAGEIDWVNDSFTRISGYKIDEVIGRTPGSVLQGSDTDSCTVVRINQALKEQQSFHEEILNYHKDGSAYWIEIHCNPLKNKNGDITGFMAIETDISAQRESAQALLQAKEDAEAAVNVKSEFLASMSHEIRTPMNGVIGMLNLLMRDPLPSEQLRRAKLANSSAHALLNLINDILDFSKVDAGKLELESLDFNLCDELGELAESMAIRAQEKGIELILDTIDIEHSMVRSDPNRLRQILTNLVGNAIKFTDTGEISIHCKLQEINNSELLFIAQVVDTGIGIAGDKIPSLFESFTQVDTSTTREYGGTGLGLAITKRLCALFNGGISVRSNEGQGSCFEVSLTLQSSALSQPISLDKKITKTKVLIVDDNFLNAETLTTQLQRWNINATAIHSAELALDTCRNTSTPYDLIVIDRKMPRKDGISLGAEIHALKQYQDTPLILMKEMSDDINAKDLSMLGFQAIFPKPMTTRDLLSALGISSNNQEQHSVLRPEQHYANTYKNTDRKNTDYPGPGSVTKAIKWPPNSRVLLVEDNSINQEVALGILEDLGLETDVVNHGGEAISALNTTGWYNLILMDCQMPTMDGYEASRQIRQGLSAGDYCNTPIIAMTANAMVGDREKCLAAGMSDYLAKPIEPDSLEACLNRWLMNGIVNTETALTPSPETDNKKTTDSNIWDEIALLNRVNNREDRALKLIDMYLNFLPERIERLETSQRELDFQELRNTAHAIKGVAGNLSASECYQRAEVLEQSALLLGETEEDTQKLIKALKLLESVFVNYTEQHQQVE